MRQTVGGVEELLQSSWRSLQLLVLVSLQDHLHQVKLLHQPGLCAALVLILLHIKPVCVSYEDEND